MNADNILDILDNHIAEPAENEYILKSGINIKKIASLSYKEKDVGNPAIIAWLKDMTNGAINTIPEVGNGIRNGNYAINHLFWQGDADCEFELAIFTITKISRIIKCER